jgi:predicted N-acetyltransferase YhbS
MSLPEMTIRTVATEAEHKAFFQAMGSDDSPNDAQFDSVKFARWLDWLQPRAAPLRTTLRGAFQDSLCLGTYQIEERVLCIGPARILTGCIGEVATLPSFRRQGVATALMHDAIAWAQQAGYPLLLLVGIQNFYGRFGYSNIMDYSMQVITLADLATQPPSPYNVRAATAGDSDILLALYQKQYNRFERSLALQAEHLRNRLPQKPPWLAYDEQGQPQGYLLFNEHPDPGRAQEVATNNWPATLALLHHHASLIAPSAAAPTHLRWPWSFDTPQAYEVSDHLPVEWEIYRVPDGEWMARVVDLPTLVRLLEPAWRERWQRAERLWWGRLTQIIGNTAFTLEMDRQELRLLDQAELDAPTVRLHPSTFTKLIFGWRPITWALSQPATEIPQEVIPIAEILYPMDRLWFPPSDEF